MNEIDQLDALVEAAEARWDDEALTQPKSTSWGMFAYGDAPAGIGGGVGSFIWFDNKTALFKFVAEVFPFSPPGPSSSDPLAVAASIQALLSDFKTQPTEIEKIRKKLNLILRSYSQIEWIGTYKDMKSGNGPYPKKIIQAFRRSRDLPIGTKPVAVSRSQIQDFKDFLAEYGV